MTDACVRYIKDALDDEFKRIGIPINVINVSIDRYHQHINLPYGTSIMEFQFYCNELQYQCLAPFIKRAEREDVAIYQDTCLSTHYQVLDQSRCEPLKTKTRYNCYITMQLTYVSMQAFIESFRETTNKLFIDIESKAFDEEVVKVLSEE